MDKVSIIGTDLAKQRFQLFSFTARWLTVRLRFARMSHEKVLGFLALQPLCLVAMEACANAHYWTV